MKLLKCCLLCLLGGSYFFKNKFPTVPLAWENSRRFTRSPLEPSQNDIWVTSAEIPYWWRVSTQILVVLLIGCKKIPTNQKHYQDLGRDASSVWNFCARYSDVVLRGLKWLPSETSAVFSGYGSSHFYQIWYFSYLDWASPVVRTFIAPPYLND